MAHKKGVGSTDNGRDSHSKRLGVKLFGGQYAIPGNIIVRQRGTKFHPGLNVGIGKDHTLYAREEGFVTFRRKRNNRTFVSVEPMHVVTDVVIEGTMASLDARTEAAELMEEKVSEQVVEPVKEPTKAEVKSEEPKEEIKAKTTETPEATVDEGVKTAKPDDLTKIKGIGPKTSEKLIEAGIKTYEDLANVSPERLTEILNEAGYGYMDASTWSEEAGLLAEGKRGE